MEKSSAVFHSFYMFLKYLYKHSSFCLLGSMSPGLEFFKRYKIYLYFLCSPCQGVNPDLTQLVSTHPCFSESLLESHGHVQGEYQLDRVLAWCLSHNPLYLGVQHIIVLPDLAERATLCFLTTKSHSVFCTVQCIKTVSPVVKSSVYQRRGNKTTVIPAVNKSATWLWFTLCQLR